MSGSFLRSSGDKRYFFQFTESDLMGMESIGGCLACGEVVYGVEPDAERYECECCGARQVYGGEQLLLIGRADVVEGGE